MGAYFLLAIVAILSHQIFLPAALGIMDSDFALFAMQSGYFREGKPMVFIFQQTYGGSYPGLLRAVWEWVCFQFISETPETHLSVSMTFTYIVVPVLLSWASYFMASRYFSRRSALLGSLIVAIGFQFPIQELFGTDYYWGYVLLGCLLLGIRSSLVNPIRELSPRGLVLSGAISGLAVYTCRASLIYLVAFWVPWRYVASEIRDVFSTPAKPVAFLRRLGVFFVATGAYLEIFGSDIGTVFGKKVKLYGEPNWQYAAICFGLSWLIQRRNSIRRKDLHAALISGMGFMVGFLPELYFWLVKVRTLPPSGSGQPMSIQQSLALLAKFPNTFRELISGDPTTASSAGCVLLSLGAFALLIAKGRKDHRLWSAIGAGALALVSYFRIHTYTVDGPTRYLFPLLPTFYLGLACLVDFSFDLLKARRNTWAVAAIVLVACLHVENQIVGRISKTDSVLSSGAIDRFWKVVETFRAESVPIVLTDDYQKTNQLSFLSQRKQIYLGDRPFLEPFEGADLLSKTTRVGVLLSSEPKESVITLRSRQWKLEPIGKVGSLSLYVGEDVLKKSGSLSE